MKNEFPTTVEAAVRLLKNMMNEVEQAKIALMLDDELIKQHFSLGL